MSELRQVPEVLDREDLAALLHHLGDAVATGDSMEGFVEYLLPDPALADAYPAGAVLVTARYRTGNLDGSQGGMQMIGRFAPAPE